MPFDVLVRELDGVIYDSVGPDGKGAAVRDKFGLLKSESSEKGIGSAPMDGARGGYRRDHSWHGICSTPNPKP